MKASPRRRQAAHHPLGMNRVFKKACLACGAVIRCSGSRKVSGYSASAYKHYRPSLRVMDILQSLIEEVSEVKLAPDVPPAVFGRISIGVVHKK